MGSVWCLGDFRLGVGKGAAKLSLISTSSKLSMKSSKYPEGGELGRSEGYNGKDGCWGGGGGREGGGNTGRRS